jgi:hypothetical protein
VCYGEWQPEYVEWRYKISIPIEFIEGKPTSELYETLDTSTKKLLIVDDQMTEVSNDPVFSRLFTKGSHHRNLSVIFLTQNIFQQGSETRTTSLNANYMVLFKAPRDSSQVSTLGRQLYPKRAATLLEAFEDATSEPFNYLLIDLKQSTPDWFRLKSKIFYDENMEVYVPTRLLSHAPVYKP